VIFVLILVLFGPDRAQGIFRAFGKGLKEFKNAMSSLNVPPDQGRPADFQQTNKPNTSSGPQDVVQDNTETEQQADDE